MSDRKTFTDSVTPLPDQPGPTRGGLVVNAAAPQTDEMMSLHFSLAIAPDAVKQMEEKVAKGEVIPPGELEKMIGAKAADPQPLISWLKANGYEVTQTSVDGVYAKAKASQVAKTLEVSMVPVMKDGVTYTSAKDAPSLPKEVAQAVQSINGLQPFRQANKHLRRFHPENCNRLSPAATGAPTTNIANAPPYLVSEILHAYGAAGLGVTGKGQTIAILIDTFPANSDLTAFWTRNGVNVTLTQIEKINVGGGSLPAPGGEETLDASWASGIAPGAHIRIYATGSLSFVALDRALDRILADLPAHPGMRQLSISLGLGETFMSHGEVTTEHLKFLRLAAAGVNIFVSSGDAGSNPDASGHSPTGPLQAEYESSDSSVIGVGGTSLQLDGTGAATSETGWSGSGGGTSIFFDRPVWQTGAGVPAGPKRVVPDVSLVADPNTGAFLVLHGHNSQFGGTSWSAPVWAGFCALMNEARHNAGKPFLPFLNPLIYPLRGTPAFRDVTAGSNGSFHCGPGYDQVTGIGVPNVRELISRLP
ncbi:MAG: S53 family peptidase [Acidobacteriota bacterium]|nr:S53 family peptidase [Acidobacteriota bacterium]